MGEKLSACLIGLGAALKAAWAGVTQKLPTIHNEHTSAEAPGSLLMI
jgi:hypothetical protein